MPQKLRNPAPKEKRSYPFESVPRVVVGLLFPAPMRFLLSLFGESAAMPSNYKRNGSKGKCCQETPR